MTFKGVVNGYYHLYKEKGLKATLLGIGPMSPMVVWAAIELGRDYDFPVWFIASRNQVDADALGGGYVNGWNQQTFSKALDKIVKKTGFRGITIKGRDHGGPWQRDNELYERIDEDRAIELALSSYYADLQTGFDFIHVDPTRNPFIKGTVPLGEVIEKSVYIIEKIEGERKRQGLPNVVVEVGTEETAGGLTSPEAFAKFIRDLNRKLDAKGLPRPAFIVGQTGTLLKMQANVGKFNPEAARILVHIANAEGLVFKEHNADYLPKRYLRIHPYLGMMATNVAPEFGAAETAALLKLARIEQRLIRAGHHLESSDFYKIIKVAALKTARWKKWLLKKDEHLTAEDIAQDPVMLRRIILVSGHYTFYQKEVVEARQRLYENVQEMVDPENYVLIKIKEAMMKYLDCFRLKGLTGKIMESIN